MKKKIIALLLTITMITLVGCNSKSNDKNGSTDSAGKETELTTIKIGATATPHGEILEALQDDFKAAGLNVEIIPFDDYIMPNKALEEGSIDANFFQHVQYLEQQMEENKYDFAVAGRIHSEPMGIYSVKHKSLDDIPEGAEIIIPDDVSNGARALLLLEKHGVIKLDDNTNIKVTESNIVENPKNIKIVPMEAANIGNAYVDADFGIINSNYALQVGLNPVEDSIVMEDSNTPYVNIVVVKAGRENEEGIKKLIDIMTSENARKFIEKNYDGAVVPAF